MQTDNQFQDYILTKLDKLDAFEAMIKTNGTAVQSLAIQIDEVRKELEMLKGDNIRAWTENEADGLYD